MKSWFAYISACLALALSLCAPVHAGSMPTWSEIPVVVDGELQDGSRVSGRVSSEVRSCLYGVDLAETGTLTVALSGSSGTGGTLRLMDSNGVTQLAAVQLSAGSSNSLSAPLLKGRYYVKVERSANEWDFQLSVSLSSLSFEDQEYNGTFFEATSAGLGRLTEGCLGFQGNGYVDARDWWKVGVDATGLFKIDLEVSSADARGSLRLYDSSGTNRLTHVSIDGSKSRQVSVEFNATASTFYVEIERTAGAFEYQMTPSLEEVPVEVDKEVNDHHTAAVGLTPGKSVTGAIGYSANGWSDPEDWWVIKPEGSGMVIVSLSMVGQSGGRGTLQVVSADWQESKTDSVDSNAGKRNASVTLSPRKDMIYYVKVQCTSGAWSYSLSPTFAPTQIDVHPSERASAIQLPGTATGQINADQTVQWYKVTVPRNGKLNLDFATDKDPGAYFRLYDVNALRQLQSEWVSGKKQISISRSVGPGTYFIQVARYYSNDFSYSIATSFEEAQWKEDSEPNDLSSLAADLQLGGSITGHIGYQTSGYADEVDWHKLTVAEDGTLTVELETTSDPGSYLRLFDANGATKLAEKWVSGATKASVEYRVAPGVYYVQLARYYDDRIFSYRLLSKLTPAKYASDREPNDSVPQAVRLGVNSVAEGHIGYYANRYTDPADWYYVDIAQDCNLTLALECTSNPGSYLKLYDTNGAKEIASVWINGTTQASLSASLRPGRYFAKVERYYSDRVYSYKLTPSVVPAELDSDKEFNNHYSTAVEIQASGAVTGNLGYYASGHTDSSDWFKVRIPSKSTFVTSLAATASPGSYLKVYDSNLKEIGSSWIEGSKVVGQVRLADLDPGTYYVLVSQYYSDRVYSYVLTTATYRDSDGPSVVTTFPADGSQPDARSLIAVPLAGDIDKGSVTEDTLKVTTASGNRISGKVVCSGNTAVFYPDQKLTDGERYTVTLAGSIKGVNGATLGRTSTFSFTPTGEAAIEVPEHGDRDRLAGYTSVSGTSSQSGGASTSASVRRSATLSVGSAGLGPLSMLRVSVSKLEGMDEVVAYRLNDSSPVQITESTLFATTSDRISIAFLDADGKVVESAVLQTETNPELILDFAVAAAPVSSSEQRVVGSIGVAKLGLLNTVRVTISEVTGVEGATVFRVDNGTPVSIGGTSILVTLSDKFTFTIESDSGEVLISEELPAESNPELVLVYKGQVELPPNHVLVGDTAISIDLFFDQPEAAGQRVNEALMTASDPSILVYIEGSEITDAFTGEVAEEALVERARENLKYIVDSNNEKKEI